MKNLVKAVLAVMSEVKNIEKKMTVGSGNNAYKGVSDKDVKHAIGAAMEKQGLVLFPIAIAPTIRIDRWEESNTYNGNPTTKTKQSVFTEVETKYMLMHTSGESMEIVGYGHGVDTQDKSAGKATTYALKNALLYTFLVPTGTLEDAENTHSDDHQVPGDKGQSNQGKTNADKPAEQKESVPAGIAPTLAKVISKADSIESLNTIWNNNAKLQENKDFLKLIAMKRIEFAGSKEDLSKIFDDHQLLHTDIEFVTALGAKKKGFINSDAQQKQTA
ncbi:ERF family protein [Sphingobacterium deserti]|uniref:ERF family protein n=1 Tax=Sphingobacterium deserti TaxID=1229276 RepID=A0A0B8T4F2_9SPHI|nr:ERF family protein [Sphingobacterium deserti]KGE14573.1 ERF family protein [Sphingobacterium deserti]